MKFDRMYSPRDFLVNPSKNIDPQMIETQKYISINHDNGKSKLSLHSIKSEKRFEGLKT